MKPDVMSDPVPGCGRRNLRTLFRAIAVAAILCVLIAGPAVSDTGNTVQIKEIPSGTFERCNLLCTDSANSGCVSCCNDICNSNCSSYKQCVTISKEAGGAPLSNECSESLRICKECQYNSLLNQSDFDICTQSN